MMLLPLLALVGACEACDGYRILLVFPVPSRSHNNLGEGYVRHLLNAGHEVTYVAPVHIKNPPKNLRQIDVSSNFKLFRATELLDLSKMIHKKSNTNHIAEVLHMTLELAKGTLLHQNVQALIHNQTERFDLVIAEWTFTEVYSGLAPIFNCPLIWSSSKEPHAMVLSLMDDPPNPAYVPDPTSTNTPPMTFAQRAEELWTYIYVNYKKWLHTSLETKVYERAYKSAIVARGRPLPPLSVAKYNGSLMLGNSHASTGDALSLPQSYVSIAGYHVDDTVQPLPKNLQDVMDRAKDGVIYFSLGSTLRSRTMPLKLKRGLLDLFGELKQTVIWKLEEELHNLSKNVHVVNFAPQQSILAHPNCILFITHGGQLSTIETIHYGVPIIGIPVFSDQFLNVDRAVQKGYAKRVDLDNDTPENLKIAVAEVFENPRYRERVKELSFVFHHRPVPPGKELVHWVEHVIKTRGAPHLRSLALMLPWYQKMYLDVFVVVLVVLLVLKRLFTKVNSLFSKKMSVCPKKTN